MRLTVPVRRTNTKAKTNESIVAPEEYNKNCLWIRVCPLLTCHLFEIDVSNDERLTEVVKPSVNWTD
jgi:hypothetical protein